MNFYLKKTMKKTILKIILISIAFSANLLQEGIYPDCSYVEVTFDGWRIHKNYEGRVLSMQAPGLHNTNLGKYSFDKFGNLIPYQECDKNYNINQKNKIKTSEVEIDVKLNFSKLFNYSISNGAALPSAVDEHFWNYTNSRQQHYPFGYHFELAIEPNVSAFIKYFSFSIMGIYAEHKNNIKPLNSIGLFINHTLNFKKLYLITGIGAINQIGSLWNGIDSNGLDLSLKNELGYRITKKISIYTQTIYTTTFLGYDEEHNHFNSGVKFNF